MGCAARWQCRGIFTLPALGHNDEKPPALERIRVSDNGQHFVGATSGEWLDYFEQHAAAMTQPAQEAAP